MKPIVFSKFVSAIPRAMIAPTNTTPCIKLEPDIKGVCKIAGTLEITSEPVKAARINIYIAMNVSIIINLLD
jgi:hypothetical protein